MHDKNRPLVGTTRPDARPVELPTTDQLAGGRNIVCRCDAGCGYTIRTTRKWLAKGAPQCPCGGFIRPEGTA